MDYRIARQNMVRTQIVRRGVSNDRVIKALLDVPRHLFVDPGMRNQAYSDNALPIGNGQTISQPYIVAVMTSLLEIDENHKVLEIGTGCGYQAAVLAQLSRRVYSVERVESLAAVARENLKKAGAGLVQVRCGDGTAGWPEHAPFDKIIVTAGAPSVPEPLFEQLAEGGKMAVPVGNRSIQALWLVEKVGGEKKMKKHLDCVFVPLLGKEGW